MAMPLLWAGTGGRKLGARVLQWTKRLTCPRGKNKLFKGEPEVCYWAQVLQDWEARTKGTGNGQEPGGDGGGEGSGRRVQWNVPDRLWQGVFSAGGPWPCGLEAGLSVCSYGVGRVCMGAQSLSHVWLCDSRDCCRQAPPYMFFFFPPREEYWSGLPFPPPGDHPDPGTEPVSLAAPALEGRLFITEPRGSPDGVG